MMRGSILAAGKLKLLLLSMMLVVTALSAGCGDDAKESRNPATMKWEKVVEAASGSTVKLYMYGGMANVNRWIDGYVADIMKTRYNITLERVPMDASVFINKLLTEKTAGRAQGTIDLLWINGENFKNARQAELLFGPYTSSLPNMRFVQPESAETDFGFPVEGYEAPYGRAQFVFEYDSAKTVDPPKSFAALRDWVKQNPGRFTYPQPPDFTGSAFIRQVFYAVTGGHEQYMKPFDEALFDANAPKLWAYLNEIEPYLWQEGRVYPKDPAFQATLFSRGEVDFMMAYHPTHAQAKIIEGLYPASVRTFVMQEGSMYNTHFTAIPFNAPNKAGAMVVSNFLMSPEAQLSKYQPANWGDFPVLDMGKLDQKDAALFAKTEMGDATLSPEELGKVAVPEIPSAWLEALEDGWEANVLHK